MKSNLLFKQVMVVCLLQVSMNLNAQNVGIGTTTPTAPLSFPNTIGNKITLYGDANGNHYGFGIQSALFQMYSLLPSDNIAFGYGRSAAFNERVRIINAGEYGMTVNGRMIVRNGTNPLDPAYTPGIWFTSGDNSKLLGFAGIQGTKNIGFYGYASGWGLTYNTENGRVGINNVNPNAPLSFPPTLEKKITLYPGNTGDAGFGMSGNRLQIFSDNPSADVAIGYDVLGSGFQERFAFKPNGAIALYGNVGQPGQVLTSNGAAGTYWGAGPGAYNVVNASSNSGDLTSSSGPIDVPGLVANFTLPVASRVVFQYRVRVQNRGCAFCDLRRTFLSFYKNISGGTQLVSSLAVYTPDAQFADGVSGPIFIDLPAGTYSYKIALEGSIYGAATVYAVNNPTYLSWQIFPL